MHVRQAVRQWTRRRTKSRALGSAQGRFTQPAPVSGAARSRAATQLCSPPVAAPPPPAAEVGYPGCHASAPAPAATGTVRVPVATRAPLALTFAAAYDTKAPPLPAGCAPPSHAVAGALGVPPLPPSACICAARSAAASSVGGGAAAGSRGARRRPPEATHACKPHLDV